MWIQGRCRVDVDSIYKISAFSCFVGIIGAKQTLFFTKVNDDDMIASGGGINDEQIKVVNISTINIFDFLKHTNITLSLGYAFMCFISNKEKICSIRN